MRGSKRKKREKNRSKDVDKSTVGKRFNANRKSKGENRPKKNHNIKKKEKRKRVVDNENGDGKQIN